MDGSRLARAGTLASLFAALGLGITGIWGCAGSPKRAQEAGTIGRQTPPPYSQGERYTIPRDDPSGTVQINTYGIAELTGANSEFQGKRSLHVRMILDNVENENDATWSVNVRDQVVDIPEEGISRPAYVNTDEAKPPLVKVEPGEVRQIDLYFPLPPGIENVTEIPSFTLHWIIQMEENGTASDFTVFDQAQLQPEIVVIRPGEPYPYSDKQGLGWGELWWYDSTYPYFAFPRAIITPPAANGETSRG